MSDLFSDGDARAAAFGESVKPTSRALEDFEKRCEVLRARLESLDFLSNRGLGNEVGFYLFCYDPALELLARDFVAGLVRESAAGTLGCRIVEFNLYDVLLGICEQRRILDKIPAQEQRRGADALAKLLQRSASSAEFANAMAAQPVERGDVVFITGVGEVYPVLRLHGLFDALQQKGAFASVPVVAFYPGRYTGQSLSLFSRLDDGNYYRAFDLL